MIDHFAQRNAGARLNGTVGGDGDEDDIVHRDMGAVRMYVKSARARTHDHEPAR